MTTKVVVQHEGSSPAVKMVIWFWLLLAIISLPMIISYFLNLWNLEHYQFFPFALVGVFYLAWTRMDRSRIKAPRNLFAGSLIAISLFFALSGIAVGSPWLNAIALVSLSTAFLYSQSGPLDKSLIGLSVPLFMLVRLPLGFDQLLVIRLQKITTQISSVFLDFLAIPHTTDVNAIQLAKRELFVAEACSGIQSVFTLAFVACMFVAINRRGLWLLPVYLVVAIVLAVVGNVLRVTTIVSMDVWFNFDVSSGWKHSLVGYIALLFAIAVLWSFENLIIVFFHTVRNRFSGEWNNNPFTLLFNLLSQDGKIIERRRFESNRSELPVAKTNATLRYLQKAISHRAVRISSVAVSVILTVASLATATELNIPGFSLATGFMTEELILNPSADIFDDKLGSIEVLSHERSRDNQNPRLGKNADVWNFRLEDISGQIVLSQTYHDWHEFCLCYGNNDWNLLTREVVEREQKFQEVDGLSLNSVPIAYARFRNIRGEEGYLFYSAVNAEGKAIYPPSQAGRLDARFHAFKPTSAEATAMMQIWVTTQSKLGLNSNRSLKEALFQVRTLISEACRIKEDLDNPQDHFIPATKKGTEK